ncbi:hypothetical protein ACIBEF_00365 [Micromonospora sp. NPDC050795]|uniref:hypothetical protein n=1 Tax=Micromonospora sp. NPDC050795 TaxID=3364282 RepID=UPI0037B25DDF
MKTSTIRRLILGAACGVAGAIAFAAPAYADDSQQPGGPLDTVVSEVVDEVLPEPEPTTEPTAEPEPTKEPDEAPAEEAPADPEPEAPAEPEQESEPVEEPEPAPDEPTTPVTDAPVEVPADAPPVEAPTTPTPEPTPVVVPAPTEPTPAPVVTPAPTEPTQPTEPAPVDTPTTTDPPAEQQPAPAPVVEVVEVVELPVIGPVAATGTMLPGPAPTRAGDTPDDREPQCTSDRDDNTAPDHGRGVVRTITDRRTGLPTASSHPAKPCPTPAGPDGQAVTAGSVKPPPPTGQELVALTVGGAYSAPVLHRLQHLRARGDIPAGRSEHIEPGPA